MKYYYKFPAVKGVQANKEYYVSMVPLNLVVKIFDENWDCVSPEFRAQRRLNEMRIPEIKSYILENRVSYVFSALSASIDGEFSFLPYESDGDLGVLEVNMDSTFLINDGQHRKAALEEALKEDQSLAEETISVVFFEDQGLGRSQQMFTDLNKHAIKTSNSIATLYDSRDPMAVATKEIINKIPFFNLYTDKEKDNLGKNSSKLFTLNSIYKANRQIIKKTELTIKDQEFLLFFWKYLVDYIEEWQELMRREISKKDLRENYILCLNVTLAAFGRLGHYFYNNPKKQIERYLKKLRKIDWCRNNMDDWGGRFIGNNGRVLSNKTAVILGCSKIKQILGIELNKDEKMKEQSMFCKED